MYAIRQPQQQGAPNRTGAGGGGLTVGGASPDAPLSGLRLPPVRTEDGTWERYAPASRGMYAMCTQLSHLVHTCGNRCDISRGSDGEEPTTAARHRP